ncbi:hypothetical protein [Bacillus taeanensis]|uniref:Uncharacterized protein n=1 Tax=Bacillus taeanensis TaxID=273032 RepID=A0A366Y0Q3_9BACI|nr:hypothetical protein [Bacillus taeanensis]RBW69983.1 hypothetical protein DS031_09015 [Bacillus taeanensis]
MSEHCNEAMPLSSFEQFLKCLENGNKPVMEFSGGRMLYETIENDILAYLYNDSYEDVKTYRFPREVIREQFKLGHNFFYYKEEA